MQLASGQGLEYKDASQPRLKGVYAGRCYYRTLQETAHQKIAIAEKHA